MDLSKLQVHGSHKNQSTLRYRAKRALSTIALEIAIIMLVSTKYAASFTPKLHAFINTTPVASATYINRCRSRITSQGNLRYCSSRMRRNNGPTDADVENLPPVLVVEGLFVVDKPLEWTSHDVVSFIRVMFERDARSRGANPGKIGSRKNRSLQVIRCGHGGTLDPLATGVLVVGLGSGTKLLQG